MSLCYCWLCGFEMCVCVIVHAIPSCTRSTACLPHPCPTDGERVFLPTIPAPTNGPQVLWSSGAFVIGASRRTASYVAREEMSAAGRRFLPSSDKLSVSANLLEDRVTRDALFHLRCVLRWEEEWGRRAGMRRDARADRRESAMEGSA